MFDKLKRLFGVGKVEALKAAMLKEQEETAEMIRQIVSGHEVQNVLFEPENGHVLRAYVQYGHSFSAAMFSRFLKVADRDLVKTYLLIGRELSDNEIKAVLDLKDSEFSQLLMDSGSWCPFPYGGTMHASNASRHDAEHCAIEEELGD